MKRIKGKFLSILMAFVMLIGMVPAMATTAHAAGTEITEAELFEQIEFTSAMINGSSIVNSNSSAFTKTNGTGWELKYSQSGRWLYFDLYLDNADIDGVSLVGKLRKDSAISVSFNVHVKGECSIGGLWLTIQHEDPKYGWGGSDAEYSRLETNIIYESDNATLSAENSIQTNGLYYVVLKVNSNGYSGATLKCSYVVTAALAGVSSITMNAVNFVAKRTSGTGAVFDVGDCTITFNRCNTLFNLPEGMVPFEDGHNNVIYDTAMVEYGGKLEKIHAEDPTWSSMYVDSNRYAAIKKSEDLNNYLNFINQDPAMPSGKTETDITATLDNTETYQFNNAALPSWLADGGFNIYRNGNLYKGSDTMPIESVFNGNSDAITVNHTFDEAGTYKLVEALTLKYFNTPVNDFVDAHKGYKKNTFNITTTEGSGEGGGEETGEIDLVNVTVTEPVANAEAVFDATEDHDGCSITDGKIYWMKDGITQINAGAKFAPNTTYRCFVALSAENGYKFTSDTKVNINGKEATYVRHGDEYAHYYYDFTTGAAEEVTATVSDVTVKGTVGTSINLKEFSIELSGDTFGMLIPPDITDWFTNIPAGLNATKIDSSGRRLTVRVTGTPTEASEAAMEIVIPDEYLENSTSDVTVTTNDSAKYSIVVGDSSINSVAVTIPEVAGATLDKSAVSVATGANYTSAGIYYMKVNGEDIARCETILAAGDEVEVWIDLTDNEGYTFASEGTATVNGNSATYSNIGGGYVRVMYSFTVEGGETPAPTEYTITATAGENGTITPSGEVAVEEGENQTFTITANDGYHIKDVKVNEQSVGAVSTYTFEKVAANATIAAEFEKNTVVVVNHSVKFDYNDGSAPTTILVPQGDVVSKPADPTREGFVFKGWFLEDGNEYDFTKPVTGGFTLTAKWEEIGDIPAHEHKWDMEDWNKNDTHHWHECMVEGCDAKDADKPDYAEHVDEDLSGSCDACGFEMETEAPECDHEVTEVRFNDEGHWNACLAEGCDYTTPVEPHEFDNDKDTDCDCGYVREIGGDDVVEHEHDWAEDYSNNKTHHWFECEADGCDVTENSQKEGYEKHDFGGDRVCDDCGYRKPASSSSSSGSTKYKVTLEDTENGSVESSRTKASKGTTVTITVDPEAGYEVDDIVVETKAGKEVEVTDKGEGKFTFKMPAANVTVSVDFAKADVEDSDAKDEVEYIQLTIDSVIAWVFDEFVANDVAPVIRNARTMLPARFVAEALGGVVTWDEAEQKVTIVNGEDTIVIFIGEPFATVNGDPVELDSPAFIENSRTYLPIRFIAENMGTTVTWDAAERTVTIVPGE